MNRNNHRIELGAHGERLACDHLERAGYKVVDRNARCGRLGEIDIVAAGGRCLVFCEVKTRIGVGKRGPAVPLEAIGPLKQRRLRRLAGEWLRTHDQRGGPAPWIRFDAIGVTVDAAGALVALDHVEDAF